MSEINAIVAGAGIWGATVARRLAEAGRKVLVLEKRPETGGNVRCRFDGETGIEIHSYGSHIFHTRNDEVWRFVNRFVGFNGYQHKVLASWRGRTYFLPLGLAMVNKFFGVELAPSELTRFLDDPAPVALADGTVAANRREALFDAFFRGYTSKQWGRPPEEIDPSVIRRVPVRSNWDVNYFNDYNQGIPLTGYNSLFDRMLDHPGIEIRCGSALHLAGDVLTAAGVGELPADVPVYYSGPLDALFDHRFGHLPWRTLRFELERLDVDDFQGTTVVNYTEASVPYTRIHEFKHYHPEPTGPLAASSLPAAAGKTVIMREYSAAWKPGDEPYYPIDDAASRELLARYQAEVERFNRASPVAGGRLRVGGRLGGYKYYDMDKSLAAALAATADPA